MKSVLAVLTVLLLLCYVCSSSTNRAETTTIVQGDTTFSLDRENGRISDGENVYTYDFSPRSNGYRLEITYPDGSSSWWESTGNGGYGGWSDNYEEGKYVDDWTLRDIILEGDTSVQTSEPKNWLLILLLAGMGAFNLILPRASWYLGYGWRFRNAEPSDLALAANRIGGGAILAVALLMVLV